LVLNGTKVKGKVASWLLATDLGVSAGQIVGIYRERFCCEQSFREQKQEFELEGLRVEQAHRLENLLLALAIVLLVLAVIGMRAKKLGYGELLSTRKKKREVLSWVQVALALLRESSKLLEDAKSDALLEPGREEDRRRFWEDHFVNCQACREAMIDHVNETELFPRLREIAAKYNITFEEALSRLAQISGITE